MIFHILKELERVSGKTAKCEILRKHSTPELARWMKYALDPYKKFHVRKVRKIANVKKTKVRSLDVFDLLDTLSTRKITGNKALRSVEHLLSRMNSEDGEVLRRVLKKDLRCGVGRGIINSVWPNLIPEFKLQFSKSAKEEYLEFPCWAEPKIDGMRMVAFPGSDEYLSRGGRPIDTMHHLTKGLVKAGYSKMVLDGEAKIPELGFEDSQSAIKRKEIKEGVNYSFYVFDCLTVEEFSNKACKVGYLKRRKRLDGLKGAPGIIVLKPRRVESLAEARDYAKEVRAKGFEGVILKTLDGPYEFKRSRVWMKLKPEETVDVEITGYAEGSGKYKNMLGNFYFLRGKQLCSVGTGFSDEQRERFWKNKKKMVGQIIEVKFMEQTAKGKTRHAVFLRERTFKDEKC